jgi:hypothetical protein
MATFTKLMLSGSVNGKQILISATTSGSANQIHTAVAGSSDMDEIWLYAYNEATSSLSCSVLWGGTVEPNDVSRAVIPPRAGRYLLADGKLLQNGLTVSAYGQLTNYIVVDGFVNRVSN